MSQRNGELSSNADHTDTNKSTFEIWRGLSNPKSSGNDQGQLSLGLDRRPVNLSAAPSRLTTETLGPGSSVVSMRNKLAQFEKNIQTTYFHEPNETVEPEGEEYRCEFRNTLIDLKIERERRHFSYLSNRPGFITYQPRGRRYIPHGYGEDFEFKPHPGHQEPKYTDIGLDWKSRLRYIPSPHNPDNIGTEIWPEPWKGLRTYPWTSRRTKDEWSLHPDAYGASKRCEFDGEHKATSHSSKEISHSMLFGKGRLVIDRRNGITQAAPGDKSYQVVEYSPSFHKMGSTLPIVDFGGNGKISADTFVPLQELPPIPRESYHLRERRRQVAEESKDVKELERWRPASPLQPVGHSHPLPIAKNEPMTVQE